MAGAGAFTRPGSNAAPFRENDALARRILKVLAHDTTHPAPAVAGGAFRRHGPETAEFKGIWTHSAHRRHRKVYLTTGPRQPEAKHLNRNTGYQAQFDLSAGPETIGALAFTKDLPPASR